MKIVLCVSTETLTDEQERAFIEFYELPTARLKCKEVIKLTDFKQVLGHLKATFKAKDEAARLSVAAGVSGISPRLLHQQISATVRKNKTLAQSKNAQGPVANGLNEAKPVSNAVRKRTAEAPAAAATAPPLKKKSKKRLDDMVNRLWSKNQYSSSSALSSAAAEHSNSDAAESECSNDAPDTPTTPTSSVALDASAKLDSTVDDVLSDDVEDAASAKACAREEVSDDTEALNDDSECVGGKIENDFTVTKDGAIEENISDDLSEHQTVRNDMEMRDAETENVTSDDNIAENLVSADITGRNTKLDSSPNSRSGAVKDSAEKENPDFSSADIVDQDTVPSEDFADTLMSATPIMIAPEVEDSGEALVADIAGASKAIPNGAISNEDNNIKGVTAATATQKETTSEETDTQKAESPVSVLDSDSGAVDTNAVHSIPDSAVSSVLEDSEASGEPLEPEKCLNKSPPSENLQSPPETETTTENLREEGLKEPESSTEDIAALDTSTPSPQDAAESECVENKPDGDISNVVSSSSLDLDDVTDIPDTTDSAIEPLETVAMGTKTIPSEPLGSPSEKGEAQKAMQETNNTAVSNFPEIKEPIADTENAQNSSAHDSCTVDTNDASSVEKSTEKVETVTEKDAGKSTEVTEDTENGLQSGQHAAEKVVPQGISQEDYSVEVTDNNSETVVAESTLEQDSTPVEACNEKVEAVTAEGSTTEARVTPQMDETNEAKASDEITAIQDSKMETDVVVGTTEEDVALETENNTDNTAETNNKVTELGTTVPVSNSDGENNKRVLVLQNPSENLSETATTAPALEQGDEVVSEVGNMNCEENETASDEIQNRRINPTDDNTLPAAHVPVSKTNGILTSDIDISDKQESAGNCPDQTEEVNCSAVEKIELNAEHSEKGQTTENFADSLVEG